MKIMKMRKLRPYCVQLQAQQVTDWTRTVYGKSGSRKPWTGKDLRETCGGPNPHSSTVEKAKPRIDFQSRISKPRYCA